MPGDNAVVRGTTQQRRDEWKRLAEQATPGPWDWDWYENDEQRPPFAIVLGPPSTDDKTVALDVDQHDAAFIAAAREAVPALLAEVESLTAERDELREAIGRVLAFSPHDVHSDVLRILRSALSGKDGS